MTTALLAPVEDYDAPDYQAPLDATVPPVSTLQQLYTPYQRRVRFLQAMAQGKSATWAARYGGNSRMQFYNWQNEIPGFREAWKECHDEAGGDVWEDLLLSKAESNNPASVTAVVVGLKMRKRFIENAPSGDRPVQVRIINVVRGESATETLRIDNVPARDNVRELAPGQQTDTDTPD